jgi:hypothetical protein
MVFDVALRVVLIGLQDLGTLGKRKFHIPAGTTLSFSEIPKVLTSINIMVLLMNLHKPLNQ